MGATAIRTTMLTRSLGRTGLRVPLLGLGTVKFGRTAKVSYARPYSLPSDAEVANLLALAKSLGVTLLDTAPAYGSSEQRIGEAIAGKRADWLLCTKTGEEFDGVRSRYDFSEAHTLHSVERSLRRLRTDFLDIVLIHADGRQVADIEKAGAFRALRRLQSQGVVRAVGFSAKGLDDGRAALPEIDVLMCDAGGQEPLLAGAADAGAGVLVKKPLAGGFRPAPHTLVQTAALAGVSCVVVGTIDAEHLAANAAALIEDASVVRC